MTVQERERRGQPGRIVGLMQRGPIPRPASRGDRLLEVRAVLVLAAALPLLPPASPGTASAQTPGTPPGAAHATATAQDAYLDETARHLVRGLKAARDTAQLGIDAYTALIRERMAVDAPTSRRDQPYVNGERVTRVRWSREEFDVARVLGSRFRDPGQGPNDPYGYFVLRRAAIRALRRRPPGRPIPLQPWRAGSESG